MHPNVKREPLRVILDSNAFFVPLQFKIDIFERIRELLNRKVEFILLSPIRRELEELVEKGSPKMRQNASYALGMARKCRVVDLNEEYAGSPPDEVILEVAGEWKCPVFTNDKKLRKKLRNINVPVIYVRQKSHLEIDGSM